MSTIQSPQSQNTYHVKVGLVECTVSCGSKNEAVEMAKDELRQQMPHMGTIIQGIRENEFHVAEVNCPLRTCFELGATGCSSASAETK